MGLESERKPLDILGPSTAALWLRANIYRAKFPGLISATRVDAAMLGLCRSMSELPHAPNDGYEWQRSYLALSRTGVVTPEIEACEAVWAQEFGGYRPAVEQVRHAPGYPEYVNALRSALRFPLTLYRVARARDYDAWRSGHLIRPISATFVLEFARLIMDVYPNEGPTVLVQGEVSDPEAVIMRGRVTRYELVLDSGRIARDSVKLLSRS